MVSRQPTTTTMALQCGTGVGKSSWTLCMIILLGLYSGSRQHIAYAQQALEPQCSSLDGLIDHIVQSMNSMPGTATICAKIPGCTGIRCSLNILGQNIGISLRMYPCATPAQMRLRIFIPSSGINFSQMITHGTTISLPGVSLNSTGFQYSPLPGIRIQAQIAVNFKKVPEGLKLGLWFQARGFGTGINWPIVPDYIIMFPPCTPGMPGTPPPPQSQCGRMEALIARVPPPPGFTCAVFPDCLGFHCFGSINAVILTYAVNVSLTINHCDVPVSYTVAVTNPGSPLLWQHRFYHNATVPVVANFPGRTNVKLQVLMQHSKAYIETSIKVIVCLDVIGCFDISFMSNEQVPVPPCTTNAPVPIMEYLNPDPVLEYTTPECLAWQRVENSLKAMNVPGLRVSYCYIEAPMCNHIMCTADYNGQRPPATSTSYSIYAEVKHCTQPMMLLVSVRGLNNDFVMEQRISADTNVSLNKNGVLLNIHFRELNGAIQLSAAVLIPLPGTAPPVNLPLIKDQLIPLPNCAGGGIGGNEPNMPNQPVYPTNDVPFMPNQPGNRVQPGAKPASTEAPTLTKPNNNRVPKGNAQSKNSAVPLAIGLLFTSFVIIGAAFGAFYWYRRPRSPPTEQTVLVEEPEHDMVRFSIGAR
ncbi:uncharacterized protein LOC110975195 [Acanthaster planci]|uniref:Uncharacterized protein LOC110975195 n=1 Tax=Acanthaster planci TaxID=133434 RepID=A0A8B7XT08_ACAPL|nr:uncharacterized protein LOC110975195 [Acanthaster planci]